MISIQSIPRKSLFLSIIAIFFCLMSQAQSFSNTLSKSETLQILNLAIANDALWKDAPFKVDNLTKIYLLDHGVSLNVPDNFSVHGTTVEVVQKAQLATIGDVPLVQVHTLNVEKDLALLRLYLKFEQDGTERNANAEFFFSKNGDVWKLKSK